MDVKHILNILESSGMLKLGRQSGDWMMCHCPFHKDGQERRPSCGVSLKGSYERQKFNPPGQFHCFTCGETKGMNETLEFLFSKFHPPKELIESITSLTEDFDHTYEQIFDSNEIDQITNLLKFKKAEYAPYPTITEEELASYRFTVPYMYERKLTDEVINRFDVGFDANYIPGEDWQTPVPCLTFPVRNSKGKVLFIYRRSVVSKHFFMPTGIRKPVYGLDTLPQSCASICICESIINALTCESYGYPAVALLGTGDEYQYSQLIGISCPNFILCLDGDEAGRKGTRQIVNKFKNSRILWKMDIPDGKDVNDLSKEEFNYLISHLSWV